MSTDTFTCFPSLPAELRLLIWEEALSVRTVWAVSRAPDGLTTSFLGPAPYLVGMSCNEARRVMEKTYIRPTGWQGDPVTTQWIDPDNTVVYLGDHTEAAGTLDRLDAALVYLFKHVALDWYSFHFTQYIDLARVCQRQLPWRCPALETLIVGRVLPDVSLHTSTRLPLGLEVAACYAGLPAYSGPVRRFRASEISENIFGMPLLKDFNDPAPRLHLLDLHNDVSEGGKPRLSAEHWGCFVRDPPAAPKQDSPMREV
jgi:hypothetical protein